MTDDQLQKRARELRDKLHSATWLHDDPMPLIAAALRDAYRQGLEDAARVCDRREVFAASMADEAKRRHDVDEDDHWLTQASAHESLAVEIRKLAGEEQKGKA